jgi:hypothetical protein
VALLILAAIVGAIGLALVRPRIGWDTSDAFAEPWGDA